MEGIGFALVRRGGKQQQVWRRFRQPLPQFEAGHLVGTPTETVGFVHDDQVPTRRDQVLEPLAVVLPHLDRGTTRGACPGA